MPNKDQSATPDPSSADELDFTSLKIEGPSFTPVMGELLGLSASQATGQHGAGDFFSRVKAQRRPDGSLTLIVPGAGGAQREIRVPAGHWRVLTPDELAKRAEATSGLTEAR